jgi:hypothetical protein
MREIFWLLDADGVMIAPRAEAAAVLGTALEMDFEEHSM